VWRPHMGPCPPPPPLPPLGPLACFAGLAWRRGLSCGHA
jgi:hypothetical protein